MTDAPLSPSRLRLGIFALWLFTCAILLIVAREHIAALAMWDPDDFLRLQQIRDLLGGQSFFDVTQYRIDPPEGVVMHWSRIVDLPLAGLILLLQPLIGAVLAERVAVSVVPLLILAGSLSAVALAAARLADRRIALLAAMLAATAPLILFHVMPLRIDHHGLQTMLGLFAIAACFDPRPRRGGLIAGAAAAAWLAISLEALPMVAALSVLLAVRFVIERKGRRAAIRFGAFAAALALCGVLLFAGLHAPAAYGDIHCDAAGPAWFGPLVLAPALAVLGLPLAVRHGVAVRMALLAIAGAAGVALLGWTAPACLDGPFAALDPLSRAHWYENVHEGLPVWKQSPRYAMMLTVFPLIGLAGTLLAWRRAATRQAASDWLMMLGLLGAAFAIAMFVQRAGAFAHACALPGAAWLIARLAARTARLRSRQLRLLASALVIGGLSPIGAAAAGLLLTAVAPQGDAAGGAGSDCYAPCSRYDALSRLPPAYMLTGLDLTPRFLVTTPHSYAGSGHHRGREGISRVITAFLGTSGAARRIMVERGMTHVLIDPNGNEAANYIEAAPDGFMAQLARNKAPEWLEPVPLGDSKLKLWRRVG